MYFRRFLLLICLFVCWISPVIANECSKKDHEYADFWENYYVPEDAYAFGKKIQRLISNKDLSGIFSLVRGELKSGPRKAFIATRSFDEVFDEHWIEKVLSNNPDCSPVGWRGFMLGHGMIWYSKSKNGWEIISINGAVQETIENPLSGWTINKRIVHPYCFNRPWASGDNFEEFADLFGITNIRQFFKEPGQFIGSAISSFSPIKPNWCLKDEKCKSISLVAQLEQCSATSFDFEDRDGDIWINDSSESYDIEYQYKILGEVSNSRCSELAPHLEVNCKKSYLISVGNYSGGSMGWDTSIGIYGLFDLPNFGQSIVPLKFFPNTNEGLNFLNKDNISSQ